MKKNIYLVVITISSSFTYNFDFLTKGIFQLDKSFLEYSADVKEIISIPFNYIKKKMSGTKDPETKEQLDDKVYVHRGFNKQYQGVT